MHVCPQAQSHPAIRVVIADACPVIRTGLITTIEAEPSMQVIATVTQHQDLLPQLRVTAVDVLVMHLIGLDDAPIAFLREIKQAHPHVGVVVLAPTVDVVPELLAAGASACLSYTDPDEQLRLAIRAAKARQRFLSPLAQEYVDRCANLTVSHRLVPRELQILKYMTQGMRVREIASHLDLCDDTIQNYITRIRNKTGWSSRTQMASWYLTMYGNGSTRNAPHIHS